MNKKEALLFAVVAQAAYNNRCDDKDFCITAKFENKGTDTQGLFGVAFDNTFVIGFRGSEETGTADWITDLKFVLQSYAYAEGKNPSIKVHYGFIEAYTSVRDAVLKAAKDTPHKRIITAGHSLGGALATLGAMDIRLNVPGKEVSCYTYGSPKVGNAAFAASYNKLVPATYRFVNDSDLVPTIPPLGYEHVGKLHQLVSDGAALGLLDRIKDKMEDHFPFNYIKALQTQFK